MRSKNEELLEKLEERFITGEITEQAYNALKTKLTVRINSMDSLEPGEGEPDILVDEPIPYCGTCGSFVKEGEGFLCEECERICHENCRLKHPDSLVVPICKVCGKDAIAPVKEEKRKRDKDANKKQDEIQKQIKCALDAFNEADDERLKREVKALKEIGKPARDALIHILKNENDEISREGAVVCLAMMGYTMESERALTFTLQNDSNSNVRIMVVNKLAGFDSSKVHRALIKALESDQDSNVRLAVIHVLGECISDEVARRPIIKAADNDECDEVREKADEVRKQRLWFTQDEKDQRDYGVCFFCGIIFRSKRDYEFCSECNPYEKIKEERFCHSCLCTHDALLHS